MEDGQKNITSFLGKRERANESSSTTEVKQATDTGDSWICTICGHRLDLLDPMYDLLLQEHQDYHFAMELSRTPGEREREREAAVIPRSEPKPKVEAKRRKKDIRTFFKPR